VTFARKFCAFIGRSRYRSVYLWATGFALFCMNGIAEAQSCALCYTQAASAGSRLIHALRSGIIVLIIPPALMSIGITILAYRKRNQFSDSTRLPPTDDWQ
jgi:hypothetical protein